MVRRGAAKTGKRSPRSRHSEGLLVGLEKVTLTLEDKTEVTLNVSEELRIPEGSIPIWKASRKAPARYAFWAYQTARALASVRFTEQLLVEKSAEVNTVMRRAISDGDMDGVLGMTVEAHHYGVVDSMVNQDKEVKELARRLMKRREMYELLRAIRDAMEHRTFILRKMLNQSPEAIMGT